MARSVERLQAPGDTVVTSDLRGGITSHGSGLDVEISEPAEGSSADGDASSDPDRLVTPTYGGPAFDAHGTVGGEEVEHRFGSDSVDRATEEAPGATVQLDDESQKRISELLEEGQGAFDAGEYQSAIDSWSRVFLIDIDHSEANRRIEQARRVAAEAERQVEEVFHEALSHLDSGSPQRAG